MKLPLSQTIVFKLTLSHAPIPGTNPLTYAAAHGPNYLVYDDHRDAPPGFAVRVGKKASIYLVDKLVARKKLKIPVGLASGKKGNDKPMSLTDARIKAWDLIKVAITHGANPKDIAVQIEASELTFRQVWDQYAGHLTSRAQPAKANSMASLAKARQKFKDWEDRKVRLIGSDEIIKRFDFHAIAQGHRTAAEAMGRWATAAVDKAIELEIHNAHSTKRNPSLVYNPFTILRTEGKYRTPAQLEREYAAKGVRNPLSFDLTVAPFIKSAWSYRSENPVASDFLLLTLLWGMRQGESATFRWRDRISESEAATARWVDMERRVARVSDAKNRGDHEFPIAPCAFELLKRRRAEQLADEIWVFPARSPRSVKGHYSDASVALRTVKERAGIKQVRGHDLRRTFGAACERLGFTDRQTKRMLGHAVSGSESLGRYTTPEWDDIASRMERIEELVLEKSPAVYNALRPRRSQRMVDAADVVVSNVSRRKSRRRAR